MRTIGSCLTRIFLVVFLVLSADRIQAQQSVLPACEEAAWNKIRICQGEIPEYPIRIFIITNRPYFPEAENREYFPNAIADTLTYFIAVCSGNSWQFHFVSGFEEGMNAINDGRDILLFIEGHRKTLPMALDRAMQVQARYGISMVVFDWPSYNLSFNGSLQAIRGCEKNFYNLLVKMKEYRGHHMDKNQHLSILAHSMGNYFLNYSVERDNGINLGDVFVDNIVMNAPAIPAKEHGKAISQMTFQRRIYITSNKNDVVLRGAGTLTSARMLGNVVVKPLTANAQYVDFSDVAGTEHSYYYGRQPFEHTIPAFYFFYNTSLHGKEVDFSEPGMFVPQQDGPGYRVNGSLLGK